MKNYLFTTVKKLLDFSLYYFFLVDLYLLSYFSKKVPYLFFVFSFAFGTFGYSKALGEFLFLVKIACFLFSWYLISTSFIVFCVFNIPTSKRYLYNLLGKDFVSEKIGNPGLDTLAKYSGAPVLGLAVNEVGRVTDSVVIVKAANSALNERAHVIEGTDCLSAEEKGEELRASLKIHADMAQAKPQGTFDRMLKVEAHDQLVKRASEAVKGLFGNKKD